MDENSLRQRIDTLTEQVVFSITRINYLFQIVELSKVNNRILRRFDGFFAMAARDFVSGVVVAIRSLHETRPDTHNLMTLKRALDTYPVDRAVREKLVPLLSLLGELAEEDVAKRTNILANSTHAHKSLKRPKKEVIVTYTEMREHLTRVISVLNGITGVLWNSSTLPAIPASEDDQFFAEMQHIELAEDIGTWMLRMRADDELVIRRKEFIERMKSKTQSADK